MLLKSRLSFFSNLYNQVARGNVHEYKHTVDPSHPFSVRTVDPNGGVTVMSKKEEARN